MRNEMIWFENTNAITPPTATAAMEMMMRFRSSARWSSIGMRASGVRVRFLRRSLIMAEGQRPGARNREGARAGLATGTVAGPATVGVGADSTASAVTGPGDASPVAAAPSAGALAARKRDGAWRPGVDPATATGGGLE